MTTVRTFRPVDWPAVWRILEPVLRAGDTYSFATDISENEAHRYWIETPDGTFVAEGNPGEILGTYYIRANQPGQGSHVCNCGYVVGPAARRRGIAELLCRHSQEEAVSRGFRSMQYNLVVSTNEVAVRLWKKLGFEIAGTLREAFLHPVHGYVDAYIMYKTLE